MLCPIILNLKHPAVFGRAQAYSEVGGRHFMSLSTGRSAQSGVALVHAVMRKPQATLPKVNGDFTGWVTRQPHTITFLWLLIQFRFTVNLDREMTS
uniref:Uncharacterized protein n=1 Tax=Anguilla anguilla TaxID=7936 RepID=A0A0E9RS22_ANGAN